MSTGPAAAAIILAARNHLATLDDVASRSVVDAVDAWAAGECSASQMADIEADWRNEAARQVVMHAGVGDHLIGVADWTAERVAESHKVTARLVAICKACEALAYAARLAANAHTTLAVATAAMAVVEHVTIAKSHGAAVR